MRTHLFDPNHHSLLPLAAGCLRSEESEEFLRYCQSQTVVLPVCFWVSGPEVGALTSILGRFFLNVNPTLVMVLSCHLPTNIISSSCWLKLPGTVQIPPQKLQTIKSHLNIRVFNIVLFIFPALVACLPRRFGASGCSLCQKYSLFGVRDSKPNLTDETSSHISHGPGNFPF